MVLTETVRRNSRAYPLRSSHACGYCGAAARTASESTAIRRSLLRCGMEADVLAEAKTLAQAATRSYAALRHSDRGKGTYRRQGRDHCGLSGLQLPAEQGCDRGGGACAAAGALILAKTNLDQFAAGLSECARLRHARICSTTSLSREDRATGSGNSVAAGLTPLSGWVTGHGGIGPRARRLPANIVRVEAEPRLGFDRWAWYFPPAVLSIRCVRSLHSPSGRFAVTSTASHCRRGCGPTLIRAAAPAAPRSTPCHAVSASGAARGERLFLR